MDGLFTLVSLCAVMAIASFLAGILPLAFNLSSSRLRLVSTLGMGILVGTSLIVIIPEGVDTVYSVGPVAVAHVHGKRETVANKGPIKFEGEDIPGRVFNPNIDLGDPGIVIPDANNLPPIYTPSSPTAVTTAETDKSDSNPELEGERGEAHHAWIGIALITGFITMFLIDKLPECAGPSKSSGLKHHISLNNLGGRFHLTTRDRSMAEAETFLGSVPTESSARRESSTTIGLVIHAAADGIALGASSSTPSTHLSFLIFFAIMIHKAPAAFGLTSVLLRKGLSKRAARAHLVIFSLAAPVGALATWLVVRLVGHGLVTSETAGTWWTGMLLLFSGGTFLYVAMHSLQDMTDSAHRDRSDTDATVNTEGTRQQHQKLSARDVVVACCGMVLPVFLQIGHSH